MKKFSTIALLLALSSSVFAADEMNAQPTQCSFLPNAPDQHLVVKGDTLWGISSMFLEHAWCWPQVWGMNREEIKNPHWIYPGQIVYLDRTAGRLRLGQPGTSGTGNQGGLPTVRLSPQIRSGSVEAGAIGSIPANLIEPFLSQPLVLEENELVNTPRIVATQENHVNIAKLERAYALGDLHDESNFQVYRPSVALKDPTTKAIIGYESAYVGTVKLVRQGKLPNEAHAFVVTNTKEEMTVGDRLLPVPNQEANNYVPHPPVSAVEGQVVSVYGGVKQAGQNQTISINLGAENGIDVGTVLQLYRLGKIIQDKTGNKELIKLPDEKYGTLFVYRVFKHVSYGLIMQVTDAAEVGDIVKKPE
ncbi:LysM peptidoglycan-binding domain-containing protein [Sapientia aquatica]|uniref:LysM peptidoglycan-binding domain-containing protein n=1 Tax=Sapientia aquatica TaxID=1549640 RepID=A0A4R5W1B9_9BURK|nr:LysM peptidoglycan-binding domain-containing protein [Sapientia aquatica]TDK65883.1 LysM peptidoglycan-binding domain-containing protein [Sapientia aquatica]